MGSRLNQDQIDDLLIYCRSSPTRWKDNDTLVCCPIHGEHNPSMGISEEKQVCHCFSCGFAGDFTKLLLYSRPEDFGFNNKKDEFRAYRKANDFLIARYELEVHELGHRTRNVKRFEDIRSKTISLAEEKREVLPRFKLAPFMSGKETYQYFFDRGFTKQDMQEYMIGRDLDNKTVTIPVFYEDKQLAGVIGRYIAKDRLKNQRYKIYDDFERSKTLFPLDHFKVIDDTIIFVEGQFDAIRMHKLGYSNTLSSMTVELSNIQCEWVCKHCSRLIWIGDNDKRGLEGRDKTRKKLKNKIEFRIVDYPDYGKDVCDWSDEDIETMITNSHGILTKKLKRL